ncbi:hypothetical protein PIB30_038957 [Stylosanthes scabra]|uniref:Uncharacterized protein n=1 Tax=Stylosanthes scabra TaxID=79078 RepID=A0ABU6VF99_9FABA|nr:hypothetical protein [Stylosanthes scabra]
MLLRADDNILPRDPLQNLRKMLHREQNYATGLVQTGRLRAGKERLERRNKELKMGVIRRKDTESSEYESAESDSEEGSDESSSGGSSPDIDSENTMSEEMVQRRPFANPSPALQERRSKKRQEEPIDLGVQRNDESNIPQGTGVLGKRKQPERAAKAKRGVELASPKPKQRLQQQPQTQRAPKRRLIKLADKIGHASEQ